MPDIHYIKHIAEATQWKVAPSSQRNNTDFWWTGRLLLHAEAGFLCLK